MGGTVIIHPALVAARSRSAGALLCLHGCSRRNQSGGEVAPERHDQLARQSDNGDALGPLAGAVP